MTIDALFVLNAGSSSLKFRVFEAAEGLPLLANGRVIGVGSPKPEFQIDGQDAILLPTSTTQADALARILNWLAEHGNAWRICAIGHRIVHGGEFFSAPTVLTADALDKLETLVPLAPLHQPHALSAVHTLATLFPEPVQIGCFDTAFHAGHTPVFREFALPKDLRERGVRRYGFHGLSYEWLAQVLRKEHPALASGRVVAAHLGNGASLCAMLDGKSIDTTMGMTALDGLPMGTRSGSIDPGVTLYMMRQLGISGDEIDRILSYDSGLKGLSGITGDMRALSASDAAEAAFAIEYFITMAAQHIARMAVAVGGMDALVFTGGIGEHHPRIREGIIAKLAFFPAFKTLVVEADEERMIASHALEVFQRGN